MTDHPVDGGSPPALVEAYVTSYTSRRVPPHTWSAVSSGVKAAVLTSAGSLEAAKTMCSHVSSFLAWAHSEGLATADVFGDLDVVERYILVGMAGAPEGSRATRRAVLRRVAGRVAPTSCPAPERLRYRTLRPPYDGWQVARYRALAEGQPTRGRRSTALAILALGLGAGLDGHDMAWVRGVDVRETSSGGLELEVVGGSRPRSVIALRDYSDLIADRAAAAGTDLLIGGSTLGRHNVTSVALRRLISDASLPTLVASRLRSTWLLHHLNLGTPLSVLLPAAGLATARPLDDLLEFVDPLPHDLRTRLLCGAD